MKKRRNWIYLFLMAQFIITFAVILSVSESAQAQSGRRTPPVTTSTPIPEPSPTVQPTSSQPKTSIQPRYFFKVVSNIPQGLYMQFRAPENMNFWVINRLQNSKLISVESYGEANRKEAIEFAKVSDEAFIVFLELNENQFASSNGRVSKASQGEIWIDFWVFTPKTGKAKTSGKAILQPEGRSVGVLGRSRRQLCYPDVFGDDYLLLGASIETAERILTNFSLPIPPVC